MSKPASLRAVMPETADWIDQRRLQWGSEHVDACLRKGLRGEQGYFYAIEAGRVVGTAWPMEAALAGLKPGGGQSVAAMQAMAVLCGAAFAAFMREPEAGGAHGTD